MFRMTDISQLKTRVFHEILLIVVFLENIEFGVTPLDVTRKSNFYSTNMIIIFMQHFSIAEV